MAGRWQILGIAQKFQAPTEKFHAAQIGAMGRISPLLKMPAQAGRGLVWLYRHTLAGLIGPSCRHLPSCSEYADESLRRFGLWAGGWMAIARMLRCHPWGTSGLDFVPRQLPPGARWWMPWRYGRWRGTQAEPPA